MSHRKALCSVCYRGFEISQMYYPDKVPNEVRELLHSNLPRWNEHEGVCKECVEHFARAKATLKLYSRQNSTTNDFKILPTPLRLGASPRYSGHGVTMAFLDSGFFNHPDLIYPTNRIVKYINIVTGNEDKQELNEQDSSSWHGMMTSVVAAGNGYLSQGIYRGIASNAKLVLIKVGTATRIQHDDIRRGLEWVLENKDRYNIGIVNISCAGDYVESYLSGGLSRAVEEVVKAGIITVSAVGNAGNRKDHPVLPPASAPSVISVGGLDDKNSLDADKYDMYHSSYGPTIDGLQKPEVLAPGIWVAAPILPNTQTATQANFLHTLDVASDHDLKRIIIENSGIDCELDSVLNLDCYLIRNLVKIKINNNNLISGYYKHVDGTSFAAPIVASVIAQMLEANPQISPQQVKFSLIKTAERLPRIETDRQGWGVISPRRATAAAIEVSS